MRIAKLLLPAATILVLATAGAAPAGAQDVCITYDFAGSELCVLEETGQAAETAKTTIKQNDRCITYDFAGSEFCVIGDTIGYDW